MAIRLSKKESFYTTSNGLIFSIVAVIFLVIIIILNVTWLFYLFMFIYIPSWILFLASLITALLIFGKISMFKMLDGVISEIPCPKCNHKALKLLDFSTVICDECHDEFSSSEIEDDAD